MFIDIHTHITYGKFEEFSEMLTRKPFTVETLIKKMDSEGIQKSVLLPLTNPENLDFYAVAGNQECIEACRKYPGRLATFCNIDPRNMLNFKRGSINSLIRAYKKLGCVGIGEVCATLPVDHKLYRNLYRAAGEENMPMLFHFVSGRYLNYGAIDELHLPRLEKMLKTFPQTIFIGHSPCFWNEIDGRLAEEQRNSYVIGPIKKKGTLWRLFEECPNLYADTSAGSSHVALSRDPEKGYAFLEKFNSRLFFGTDRFSSADEAKPLIIDFLKDAVKSGKISKKAFENITHKNYERVFPSAK
ncbi:MAG: hypothetical protein A2020_13170 [Lentisphaerae bacterium GWF2_45_14]|nr:MAG: hypothetical protein A2020_13170 [Lentisphaerae bacterium GWF2_45_14]